MWKSGSYQILVFSADQHLAAVGQKGLRLAKAGKAPDGAAVFVAWEVGSHGCLLLGTHLLQVIVRRRRVGVQLPHILLAGAVILHARRPGRPATAHHKVPEGEVHAFGVALAKARFFLGRVGFRVNRLVDGSVVETISHLGQLLEPGALLVVQPQGQVLGRLIGGRRLQRVQDRQKAHELPRHAHPIKRFQRFPTQVSEQGFLVKSFHRHNLRWRGSYAH